MLKDVYFVYDRETSFILSGFHMCQDSQSDGYNIFTRPYRYPEFAVKGDTCELDAVIRGSIKRGLDLKRENVVVVKVDRDCLHDMETKFIAKDFNIFKKGGSGGWTKWLNFNKVKKEIL